MSQSERLKKQFHPPIHAFYVSQQQPNTGHEITIEEKELNGFRKIIIATATLTNSAEIITPTMKKIQTAAIVQNDHQSNTISSTNPSSTPSVINRKMSPPLINNVVDTSSFDDKTPLNRESTDNLPWIAPLLGVLGIVGVIAIVLLYLIGRNRKKKSSVAVTMINDDVETNQQDNNRFDFGGKSGRLPNSHISWASLSTINTSALDFENKEKKARIHDLSPSTPPPTYYTTMSTRQQKRLTADTLVDNDNALLMLKSQYSPQLAFSPSLVAGEFQQQQQQQQQQQCMMDDDMKNSPPLLPFNTLSPSNTLIDHAGVLLSSKEQDSEGYYYASSLSSHPHDHSLKKKKKIEMYEPQVNLQDPFIPDSYSNEESEKEEQKQVKNEASHLAVDIDGQSF